MPDRIDGLRQAAQARHAATTRRAEVALTAAARKGEPITFRGLAAAAGVSRSWLYRQPTLRDEIDRLRRPPSTRSATVPSPERATVDSLRQQLHTYREEIARLRAENQNLNDQLARKLGDARTAAITRRS